MYPDINTPNTANTLPNTLDFENPHIDKTNAIVATTGSVANLNSYTKYDTKDKTNPTNDKLKMNLKNLNTINNTSIITPIAITFCNPNGTIIYLPFYLNILVHLNTIRILVYVFYL